jgi:hypothetical protein
MTQSTDPHLEDLVSQAPEERYAAAEYILGRLGVRGHAKVILTEVVAAWILMYRREGARKVEHRTPRIQKLFKPARGAPSTRRETYDWSGLLNTMFSPHHDGTRVTWGEATIAEHEAYITWQRHHITGVERTIALHQTAIEDIRAANVSCLKEVPLAA